jgi:D-alanyl-lipoteichoic acid acyltransferase DltB (MBOAT superfamily)
MGSASLKFLAFGAVVAIVFNLSRRVAWRQAILLLASLSFLLFFSHSPQAFLPLAGFLAFGFGSLRLMQRGVARVGFAVFLIGAIGAFVWLKKYSFVPAPLCLHYSYVTLGLSYIFFRVLHLIIDAKQDALPEQVSLVSYLNYTLNFTTLISGPIQRYQDFASMQLAREPLKLNVIIAGQALERIVIGFFKVNILSLVLSTIRTDALSAITSPLPWGQRIGKATVIIAVYPIYLYCNFSGYIDIVIGLARFLRLELPENFNRPFSSDNFMNFWSRWHITLSQWLKTYVYNPLLIALMGWFPQVRLEPFLGVLAFFVTFFLVGLWHGQTSEFLFFGVLQGAGVSAVKLYQLSMTALMGRIRYKMLSKDPIYNCAARGLTFAWFAFTLLWFWSSWTQIGSILQHVGVGEPVIAMVVICLGAAILLEAWEHLRTLLLSWTWNNDPVISTRYARTVWGTALGVIALAVVALLNGPAPEIVYKGF